MREKSKALGYLGLAAKAGKCRSGEFQTENAIKRHHAKAVIIAADASENTKKSFCDMCEHSGVPVFVLLNREVLGHALGKEFRASCAITDEGLAAAFIRALEEEREHKEIVDDENQGS